MGRDFTYTIVSNRCYDMEQEYSVGRHNNYISSGSFSINELKKLILDLASELKNEKDNNNVIDICRAIQGYTHVLEQLPTPNFDDLIWETDILGMFVKEYGDKYMGANLACYDINDHADKFCFDSDIEYDSRGIKRSEDNIKKIIEEYPDVRALYLKFETDKIDNIKSDIFDKEVVHISYI